MKHTVLKRLLVLLCMLMLLVNVMGGTGLSVFANFNDGDLDWDEDDDTVVDSELKISSLPDQVYAALGEPVDLEIATDRTDLTYVWYYKNRSSKTFTVTSTFKDNYYNLAALNDSQVLRQVYCKVSDPDGNVVYTNVVTICPKVEITLQPVDACVKEGDTVTLTTAATGDGVTYRWYATENGYSANTFVDTQNTTATYSAVVTNAVVGRRVYCQITGKYNGTKYYSKSVHNAEVRQLTYTSQIQTEIVTLTRHLYEFPCHPDCALCGAVRQDAQAHDYDYVCSEECNTCGDRNPVEHTYQNGCDPDCNICGATRVTQHQYDHGCDPTCDECGATRVTQHGYDHDCDVDCNICGAIRVPKPHVYKAVCADTCTVCRFVRADAAAHNYPHVCSTVCPLCDFVRTDAADHTYTSNADADCDVCGAGRQLAAILTQPQDAIVAYGDEAVVTVAAVGPDLTYEWYFKNAGASKFSLTTAFTGDTYTVEMNESRTGRQIYCVVTDGLGNSVRSNTVTLGMKVTLTAKPKNAAAPKNKTAKVTLTAYGDGLTYEWYYRNKGTLAFALTTTFKSNSYSTAMNSTRNGRELFCLISDKYGNAIQTDIVTIYMGNPAKITKQPVNVSAFEGGRATITFTATGDGLKYKWYFKNTTMEVWNSTATFTGNQYYAPMDETRDGRQVYCVVTDKYGISVTTNTVEMTIARVTQPTSAVVYAKSGATAKLSAGATGYGLTYTWYIKNAGTSKYVKSSVTSSTYSVKMSSTVKGRYIYCNVKDKNGTTVKVTTRMLRMAATVTTQPVSVKVKKNTTAKVTVKAVGDGLKYTWYVKNPGATTYTKSSITKSTYSVKMTSANNGRLVYCVVTDKYGKTDKTKTVSMKLK